MEFNSAIGYRSDLVEEKKGQLLDRSRLCLLMTANDVILVLLLLKTVFLIAFNQVFQSCRINMGGKSSPLLSSSTDDLVEINRE